MSKMKSFFRDTFVSIIGGLVVLALPYIFKDMVALQITFLLSLIVANYYIHIYTCNHCQNKMNIAVSTIDGIGGTESILSECSQHFYFMGISGNKWIKRAKNFEKTMRCIIAKHGTVRFILINPNCDDAKTLSLAGGNPISHIKDMTTDNLRSLKRLKDQGLDVIVRVYSHMPVFRIAIVNDREKVYVGSYKVDNNGENVPQLIFNNGKDINSTETILCNQFIDYYNMVWNSSDLKTIDLGQVDDDAYLLTV